jgi:hypothetical protein
MSATEEHINRHNDTVTVIRGTYCIHFRTQYVTTMPHKDGRLVVDTHMTEEEARALLAGLQEALA